MGNATTAAQTVAARPSVVEVDCERVELVFLGIVVDVIRPMCRSVCTWVQRTPHNEAAHRGLGWEPHLRYMP